MFKNFISFIGTSFVLVPFFVFADPDKILPENNEQSIGTELPAGDLTHHFLPRFIDILIQAAYIVDVACLLYASLLYIISRGNDSETEKARNFIIYSIIGFLVITVSYTIVKGVTMIEWDF